MPGLKKEGVCMNQDIQMKQISELRLDPDNPRLPEGADTSTQAAILKLFYEDYVLDELAARVLYWKGIVDLLGLSFFCMMKMR